ncbi:MAG: MerR family transcriptional regulator [Uliginosibacterium sp.]|jgi:DNA-binding transcriptional MerR regulator|nr:MerR family transcriptional regulator [Uliginosibacterium sp.]MBK9394947.1 MerR family transcriptional regulator [Uliginosibacterium sp.]
MTLRRGPALIPIGTFSSVTHLTQKTLRFYAEQGILSPAWVDPENGYRYYRTDQITQARRIQMLREIGMSLSEIDSVNNACRESAEAASHLVHRHFISRQAQFQSECETYRTLMFGLLDDKAPDAQRAREVFVREASGGPVLAIHAECENHAMRKTITHAHHQLSEAAKTIGAVMRGPIFVRHMTKPFLDPRQRFQVCLPIEVACAPPEGMRVWHDRPHREAWSTIDAKDAEYPRFIPVIESLVDWLVSHNRIFLGFSTRVVLGKAGPAEFIWPFMDPEDEEGDQIERA